MKKVIDEDYVNSEIGNVKKEDVNRVSRKSKEISKKITSSGALKKYSKLGKAMLAMLKDYKNGTYKNVPWFTISAITFGLLYVLNPFDLVPDFIPGFGYLDDFTVFTYCLKFVESDLHKYLDWKIKEVEPNNATQL